MTQKLIKEKLIKLLHKDIQGKCLVLVEQKWLVEGNYYLKQETKTVHPSTYQTLLEQSIIQS